MNLVLGAVKKLEIELIAPFLLSLRQSGYGGKVAFFVSETSDRTCELLQQMDVTLINVNETSSFTATPVNSLRYFVYEQFLAGFTEEISNIMHADVRDIVFQRDPFTMDTGGSLCCFLEDECMTLGACLANSGWLAAAYGKETLQSLGHHPVSCSGTTIGPASLMRRYISAMAAGLRAIDDRSPNIMHAISGVDQAVHNYLLRTGGLPEARCFRNEDGPITTLGYVAQDSIRYNDEGLALNQAGEVVHVLHQYDRHWDLTRRVQERLEKCAGPLQAPEEPGGQGG